VASDLCYLSGTLSLSIHSFSPALLPPQAKAETVGAATNAAGAGSQRRVTRAPTNRDCARPVRVEEGGGGGNGDEGDQQGRDGR